MSNSSFELLWVASLDRSYSNSFLLKTRNNQKSYFSKVSDICLATLWKLHFTMDIFRDTFGKLIFYITLISQIFTVWQGYTKDFQCVFEKALKEQVHSSESSLNMFQNFKGKNLEWSTLLAKLQLVTILKKKKPPWEELSYGFSKYVENNFSPEHLWMVAQLSTKLRNWERNCFNLV